MLFTMSMNVILHKVLLILLMVIHLMLLPLIDEFIPKVTTVSRLLLLSPICLACIMAKNCYNIQKCYPMRLTSHAPDMKWSQSHASDKIFLKAHIEVLKKKKKESTSCHAFMLSCFGLAMLLLTNSAPTKRTKNFQLIFKSKSGENIVHFYYSQITIHRLLFTDGKGTQHWKRKHSYIAITYVKAK